MSAGDMFTAPRTDAEIAAELNAMFGEPVAGRDYDEMPSRLLDEDQPLAARGHGQDRDAEFRVIAQRAGRPVLPPGGDAMTAMKTTQGLCVSCKTRRAAAYVHTREFAVRTSEDAPDVRADRDHVMRLTIWTTCSTCSGRAS